MPDSPNTHRSTSVSSAPTLWRPAPSGATADELITWLPTRRALSSHQKVLLVRLLGVQGPAGGPPHL